MVVDGQLRRYARRGILAEMEEWTAKRQAVAALTGVLSEAELERMLAGIDLEIEALKIDLDELDGRM